jgi:peptidoglycan LD-endopeptidase CwlK
MTRNISDLIPEMQEKFKNFAAKMAEAAIPFMVTCTYRTQEEQDELYAKGRTAPGPAVTWVPRSRHTQRDAFDIAILRSGQPTWALKVSVNGNDIPDYQEAGQIGESVELVWGGRWNHADYPHFQNS